VAGIAAGARTVKRWATPFAALAIFLLNVLLNGPLFMHGELPFRGSIEGGYVAIARFVSAHPSPWGWDPFQYCGLPTRFLYVPALPYLTAGFSHLMPQADLAYIYRVIVSLMTCAGPVTAFFFALYFTKSRRWSLIAALVYSLLSPSYGLFPDVEKDRGIVQLPWRIQVLAKYGEGPHNTALMLMPLVLLALWIAARKRGYPPLLVAALLLAATPLVNWVGAFALAIACLLFLLASIGEPDFRVVRVCAAGGLGYLLASFWLTPTFIRTIVFNWPTDSFAYHFETPQHWLVAGMIAGALILRLLFHFLGGSFYLRFITMAAFTFGWIASFFYLSGLDTIPESRRYAIEFELFLALALVEAVRLAMRSTNSTVRLCAIGTGGVLLLAGTPQLWAYATQGWHTWTPAPKEQSIEYRLANWMAGHPPEGRVFASGGLRFRMNSWFDLPQVGGGFETGLTNRMPWDLAYHVRTGKDSHPGRETVDALLQLKAMSTQYIVIHGPKSREYYRDYLFPERITAALIAVHHEEDDTIYSLPPRPLAHLIGNDELPGEDAAAHPWVLERYIAAMEDPARPVLQTRWRKTTALTIDGAVPAGRLVAVRVNADPGWRAAQDGHTIPIETDNLGFMLLRPAAAAATHIELEYRATAEPRIMAVICALTWIAAFAALIFIWRKPSALPTTN
jgi:6-pyruvoyl-tetrahydropterin synthase related domain